MRLHANTGGRRGRALGIAAAAALTVTLAACSGSGGSGTHVTSKQRNAAASAAAAASSAPAPHKKATALGPLSGHWSGQYGGAYQGTFSLHWREKGSKLTGSIHISNPSQTLPIHGSVAGGAIRFGTVGSMAITYSGTVSGESMSGSYQVGGQSGGNWSANKS